VGNITVPLGGILAIAGFGLILFVLIYLRRYSDFLSVKTFRSLFVATLAVLFLLVAIFYYYNRPPQNKIRVAIFPFKEPNTHEDSSWMLWTIAKISAHTLQQSSQEHLLVYPLDWLWEAIATDSIASLDYVLNFAQRVRLDFIITAEMDSGYSSCPIEWQLFNIRDRKNLASGTLEHVNCFNTAILLTRTISSQLDIETDIKVDSSFTATDSVLKWTALSEQAYLQRDFATSIKLAEQAFESDSNYVPVRNLLASAHLNYGLYLKSYGKPAALNYAIAQKLCEDTIKNDSLDATAERILGEYYLLKELWSKAEEHFRCALKLNPTDARIYRDFAQLHASRFKDLGIRSENHALQRALFLNPCYEEARIQLAKYYYFKQWPSRAEKVIMEMLSIHPESIEGLLFLSKIYVSQNQILKLLEVGKKAVEIAPDNADAYFNLGVAYYHWEDYDNAKTFFQRAVRLSDHANSHLYLAYIYERKGDHETAIYHLRRRLQLRRDDLYANKAREMLFRLTHGDSTEIINENQVKPPATPDEGEPLEKFLTM